MAGAPGKDQTSSGGSAEVRSFGDGLDAFARAIITDARQVLADRELSDPEAVHAIRRALKRWRALMRLLAGPIGDEAERMRVEARDLMRSLSGARDAQSALDALADLSKTAAAANPPFSTTSLATIEKRLTAIRDAAEQLSFTPAMRDRLAQYLDRAALALDRWPLKAIEFDTTADGLIVAYRRARELMPGDWSEADAERLHDLRRRVVEHRHQMELIEPLWPRLVQIWAEEAQRLRGRLGSCQDLAMLVNFTAPHQPLAPWRSKLAPVIAARRTAHLKAAERLAGRLFAEKPKAFRRRIGALWKARLSKANA